MSFHLINDIVSFAVRDKRIYMTDFAKDLSKQFIKNRDSLNNAFGTFFEINNLTVKDVKHVKYSQLSYLPIEFRLMSSAKDSDLSSLEKYADEVGAVISFDEDTNLDSMAKVLFLNKIRIKQILESIQENIEFGTDTPDKILNELQVRVYQQRNNRQSYENRDK